MAALLCENDDSREWIDIDSVYLSGVEIIDCSQVQEKIEFLLEKDGFCVVDIGEDAARIVTEAQHEAIAFFDAAEAIKSASKLLVTESGIAVFVHIV